MLSKTKTYALFNTFQAFLKYNRTFNFVQSIFIDTKKEKSELNIEKIK